MIHYIKSILTFVLKRHSGAAVWPRLLWALALSAGLFSSYIDLYASQEDTQLDIVCHRGYSNAYPDNTIQSFQAAKNYGATAVELDVRKTSDGQLVIFHDDDVTKLVGEAGTGIGIEACSLQQLRSCDNGSWFSPDFAGCQVPLFDEVLDLYEDTDTRLFVELKSKEYDPDLAAMVYYRLRSREMLGRVVISSFNNDYLRDIKALNYCVPVMKLAGVGRKNLARSCYAEYYGINQEHLNKKAVQIYHDAGAKVYAYTPVKKSQVKHLKAIGVDGIITNFVSIDDME